MDIDRKIGEMFVVGFKGTAVTKELAELIAKRYVGGVILYARNIENMAQVARLCSDMQTLRKTVSETPLFIAIDQEGGVVHRLIAETFDELDLQ
ncbi:MAG TPA: glycoside hydrolase family 3 N-terminal domain-containing protein, partial [bacterium]|nr:glycoside hydrolase family 3 N-terminal domain-containing protein [bacterium]